LEPNRKQWFDNQKALRLAMKKPVQIEMSIALFLAQHAPLHAREVSGSADWNLEEEVWNGLTEAQFRCIPTGMEHSIAWCYWHLARIEDITMNLLVAGTDQIFTHDNWKKRLHAPFDDTGNRITPENVLALSAAVDFNTLREYRTAVGKRTREVVRGLTAEDILRKTPPERLQRGLDEGAISPNAPRLVEYWGGLTVAGLLLMPPTRHNFSHLNESLQIKRKAQKSAQNK
jgi:hypothetical protein